MRYYCIAILFHYDIISYDIISLRYYFLRYYAGYILLVIFCWRYFFRESYSIQNTKTVLVQFCTSKSPGRVFENCTLVYSYNVRARVNVRYSVKCTPPQVKERSRSFPAVVIMAIGILQAFMPLAICQHRRPWPAHSTAHETRAFKRWTLRTWAPHSVRISNEKKQVVGLFSSNGHKPAFSFAFSSFANDKEKWWQATVDISGIYLLHWPQLNSLA